MKKVTLGFIFCSVPLFSTHQMTNRSTAVGSCINQSFTYEPQQSIFGRIPILEDRLANGAYSDNLRCSYACEYISSMQGLIREQLEQIRESSEYSHVPKLSISLKPELLKSRSHMMAPTNIEQMVKKCTIATLVVAISYWLYNYVSDTGSSS